MLGVAQSPSLCRKAGRAVSDPLKQEKDPVFISTCQPPGLGVNREEESLREDSRLSG